MNIPVRNERKIESRPRFEALLGFSLALLVALTARASAGEEEIDLDVGESASGSTFFLRNGVLGRYASELDLNGERTRLRVRGLNNEVEQIKVKEDESGRIILSLLFRNPPALERGSSALLKGTVVRTLDQTLYYGDLYVGQAAGLRCHKGDWHRVKACGWRYRGGFSFTFGR